MQKEILSKFVIVAIVLLILGLNSCSKEEVNLQDLNETIFIRHKKADMPAYIHGNASEKVFLIILHGGPGGNGLSLRVNTIRSEIEKNNAVVYFDQRGSGNSQGSYSEEDVSIDIMAEDVLALAKVIKAKYGEDAKIFLMGGSWGGTLGPAVLLKNQNDFLGWIDVDGAHNPKGLYDEYKVVLEKMADVQIAIGNSIDYWQDVLEVVQNTEQSYSTEDFFKLNVVANTVDETLASDKVINEIKADYGDDIVLNNSITINWNSNGISYILGYKNGLWGKVSFTDRLSEITIPSLVLWGKYDLVVPVKFAHEAFDNLGSREKEIVIFEKSGHGPMFTEPELFAEKDIRFINEHK